MDQETYSASDGSLWAILEICPPVPTRAWDWAFWLEDDPEECGHARTRERAIEAIEERVSEKA